MKIQELIIWTLEHQIAFDALETALTTAPVLRFPTFTREFILETDASPMGWMLYCPRKLTLVKSCVIAYTSLTLRPYEQSTCNYR